MNVHGNRFYQMMSGEGWFAKLNGAISEDADRTHRLFDGDDQLVVGLSAFMQFNLMRRVN